jgi:hypothetical protein
MGSPEVASLFSEHDIVGPQKVASSSSLGLLLFEVEMGDKLQKETCSLFCFVFFNFFSFIFLFFIFIHNLLISTAKGKKGMKNA